MGMAGERECHTRWHLGENVRLMHEQNHRIIGADAGQGAGQIVRAPKLVATKAISDLVPKSRQPEAPAARSQKHRVIFHERHVCPVKRAAHAVDVVPPVVIAENRKDTERCMQTAKLARPCRVRHALGDEMVGCEIVAQHHGEIAAKLVGGIDHLPHPVESHVGSAGVQIGDDRDG